MEDLIIYIRVYWVRPTYTSFKCCMLRKQTTSNSKEPLPETVTRNYSNTTKVRVYNTCNAFTKLRANVDFEKLCPVGNVNHFNILPGAFFIST